MNEPTIIVVDDEAGVRKSLATLLRTVRLHVETFDCADDFIAHYRNVQCGCIVTDLLMPGRSGLQLLEWLRTHGDLLPVIILTGHGTVASAVRGMKLGAFDVLEKPVDKQRLVETIQLAIQQSESICRNQAARNRHGAALARLTPREREVLGLMFRGLSGKAIGAKLAISAHTVENHRARIMQKMEFDSLVDLVREICLSGAFQQVLVSDE